MSRSSRGGRRKGALFGSTSARRKRASVLLALPCSPRKNSGEERSARTQGVEATIKRKPDSDLQFTKGRRRSMFPPRCGSGSRYKPVGLRNLTGGSVTISQPSRVISTARHSRPGPRRSRSRGVQLWCGLRFHLRHAQRGGQGSHGFGDGVCVSGSFRRLEIEAAEPMSENGPLNRIHLVMLADLDSHERHLIGGME